LKREIEGTLKPQKKKNHLILRGSKKFLSIFPSIWDHLWIKTTRQKKKIVARDRGDLKVVSEIEGKNEEATVKAWGEDAQNQQKKRGRKVRITTARNFWRRYP